MTSAASCTRSSTTRRTRDAHDVVPGVLDAPGDRPRPRRRAQPRSTTSSARCSSTSATPSRTGSGCTTRSTRSIEDLEENPPPLPGGGDRAGQVAAALAGRQPLHLPRLPRVRPRGAGRRGDAGRRARHRLRHPARRPARGRGCCPRRSPRGPATSTCSSSPRPTPGRPCTDRCFLDYVGVKKFDARRRGRSASAASSGLFSSAAYTESVRRIPVLREKAAEVIDTVGLDPIQPRRQGADGRARDLPARRALPDPGRRPRADRVAGDVHPRAPAAQAVRPPRHLRPLPLLPRLPAARPLQHHRPRAHRRDPQGAARRGAHRVHRPRGGVLRRAAALRRTPGRGRADRRARHPRPRAPLRRGRALLERRLHQRGDHDVRRGAGQPARPALRQLLPRGLQGGLPAADRSGRPRAPRGDRRGRRGWRSRSTRTSTRRAGRGPVEGLPDRAAAVPLRGAADPVHHGRRGRRRAALPARGAGAGVLHLRLRAALPARDARPCARAVPGHRRGRVERLQRERRLQRPGAGSRTHLAPGHRAARLRQVHAPGRHARSRRTTSRTRCATTSRSRATSCSCSRRGSTPADATATAATSPPTARPGRPSAPTWRSASCAPSTRSRASTTTGSCGPT